MKQQVPLLLVCAISLAACSQPQIVEDGASGALQVESDALEALDDLDARAAAERLAEAVRLQTISQPSAAGGAFDTQAFVHFRALLEKRFPRLHATLRRKTIARHSLLYRWPGSGVGSAILLAAHQDVVPAAAEGWLVPPFAGVVDADFIWGRGTLDDKGSLMAIMEAVEHLIVWGFQPSRTVYLAFGHDEENDGAGAKAISSFLTERGERLAMVLDEGSFVIDPIMDGIDRPMTMIGLAEKGFLTIELSTRDAGGHSSIPPLTTAVGRLARALTRLEEKQMPARLERLTRVQIARSAPYLPLWTRIPLSAPSLFSPLILRALAAEPATAATIRTTTAVTVMQGGIKGNVLPRSARAMVNFRILPGDTVDQVLEHVRKTVDDPDVAMRVIGSPTEPSPVSSYESRAYAEIKRSVAMVFGDTVVLPSLVLGMTDARSYQPIADDVYRFLPVHMEKEDLDRLHGKNERIGIEAHADMIRFYADLLTRLARP